MGYLSITDADSEWLLIGAILVFFMRAFRAPPFPRGFSRPWKVDPETVTEM